MNQISNLYKQSWHFTSLLLLVLLFLYQVTLAKRMQSDRPASSRAATWHLPWDLSSSDILRTRKEGTIFRCGRLHFLVQK